MDRGIHGLEPAPSYGHQPTLGQDFGSLVYGLFPTLPVAAKTIVLLDRPPHGFRIRPMLEANALIGSMDSSVLLCVLETIPPSYLKDTFPQILIGGHPFVCEVPKCGSISLPIPTHHAPDYDRLLGLDDSEE